jgi:hypothetical protein
MFEAHPVPQNVTEFEFHLVGDMTIKQFVYLASGIGAAYLTFALFANKVPFLAYPLILIFAGTGAALAFLPIQERPLDHWLGAYFRAIFQPTKRTYKSKLITKEDPLFKTRLQVYLNSKRNPMATVTIPNSKTKSTPFSFSMASVQQAGQQKPVAPTIITPPNIAVQNQPSAAPTPLNVKPVAPATTILGSASLSAINVPPPAQVTPLASPTPTIQQPSVTAPIAPIPAPQISQPKPPAPVQVTPQQSTPQPAVNPSEDELNKTIAIAKQVHEVQQNIIKTEEQIDLIRSKAATQDANPKEYLDQFHQLLGDLQNLQNKAAKLSEEVAILTKEPIKAVTSAPEQVVKPKSIPTITLTSIANVINGIVTDSAGNYLDGAIILAHDKQGIPVRALKTNKLGQFVAATPLNNGIFTITIEKDTLVFDTIEIELTGSILNPILITAKPVTGGVAHG